MTTFSSKGKFGNGVGSEPVAIKIFLAEIDLDPPSLSLTSRSFLEVNLAVPLT